MVLKDKDRPQKIDVAGQKIDVDFLQRVLRTFRIWKMYKCGQKREEKEKKMIWGGTMESYEKNVPSIFVKSSSFTKTRK